MSGNTTDFLGDLEIIDEGAIVTTGNSITTFFDDVIHNGNEIRTSLGSSSVFLGSVSGEGDFTGLGTVIFEGDLRPGNSPGKIRYEGDVLMGLASSTVFELGGGLDGEYDRIEVGGDLYVNGGLEVELVNGFQLEYDMQFLVADVVGLNHGNYDGVFEGDSVGRFGGIDLFISYHGGDGNDIILYTQTVPEPNTIFGFGLFLVGIACRRRTGRLV